MERFSFLLGLFYELFLQLIITKYNHLVNPSRPNPRRREKIS